MRLIIFLIILAVALCAWCPWLSPTNAAALVATSVQSAETELNGCTLTPDTSSISKEFFGYTESVSYSCNPVSTGAVTTGTNTVFVTFFNTVIGTPHPIIQ